MKRNNQARALAAREEIRRMIAARGWTKEVQEEGEVLYFFRQQLRLLGAKERGAGHDACRLPGVDATVSGAVGRVPPRAVVSGRQASRVSVVCPVCEAQTEEEGSGVNLKVVRHNLPDTRFSCPGSGHPMARSYG